MNELQELIALKKKVLAGEQGKGGICCHISFPIKPEHLTSWHGFSGNYVFPIYVKEEDSCPEGQFSPLRLWIGRQLQERLSLLNHLIECYKKEGLTQ